MITIFSSNHCGPCHALKEILKERGIKFNEISIDTKEGYNKAIKEGITALPTIKIGNKKLIGFNKEMVEKFLDDEMQKLRGQSEKN